MKNLVVILGFIAIAACSPDDSAKPDARGSQPSAPVATSGGEATAKPGPATAPPEAPAATAPARESEPAAENSSGGKAAEVTRDPAPRVREVTIPAGPGPGTIVTFRYTYGVPTGACPWDCQALPNGSVGINDLLVLLAQWNLPGSCDFDGGNVGITDLLKLLGEWGPCN